MPHDSPLHPRTGWRSRGYLPHIDADGLTQTVTYRLADSLPCEVVERIRAEHGDDEAELHKAVEAGLDACHGSCILRDSDIAEMVVENWIRHHGERYELIAWVLMPNHAHVMVRPAAGVSLAEIVHGWKSFTAKQIMKGPHAAAFPDHKVWQEEYRDRYIRDERHFAAALEYIAMNPVKAGLCERVAEWKWSFRREGRGAGEAAHAPGAANTESFGNAMRAWPHALPALRARLLAPLEERAAKSIERTLSARPATTAYVNLADNDYLGLSRDPAVIAAGKAALDRWGASSAASPLISGYTEEHAALERELCDWCGFGHGLVWNTGFAANAAVLGTLPKPGDLVFADRLIHASMISGILASGARLVRYAHNDLGKLRELLEKHRDHAGVVWVVTESVFSMDGDYPDLKTLASLKAEYGFVLVVDEAHATGWYGATGAGLLEREGVAGAADILVGTLGKGLGGMGAYTLFHDEVFRRHLMNFAGEFVYSTYLAPVNAACARAAVRRLREIHGECAGGPTALPAEVSRRWREAIREVVPGTPEGDSPVIPIPLGDAARVMGVAAKLLAAGWRVGAVRPPTVPEDGARLRISLRLGLDEKAPAEFAGALRKALEN